MKHEIIASYLLPRLRDILFLIIFAAAMAAGWRTLNNDGDLPRHLLMGEVIVESRSVPRQELFSYVYEGQPFVATEWLGSTIYFLAYKAMGLGGVVLLTATLIASTFLVLYTDLSEQYEERHLILIFLLWGAAITYWHWVARPLLFTMIFLAIWLVLIDQISRDRKVSVWVFPVLMILWGNIHAEFVAGFLVLIAYIAGWVWDYWFNRQYANPEVIKKLTVILALSLVATVINPFGLQTWATILGYLNNEGLMSTIRETQAPDFSNSSFLVEFSLIIASILILALKKAPVQSGHAFLIAGFTTLAMTAARNIHLYGVVAPFVLVGPAIWITNSVLQNRITAALAQIERQLKGFLWPIAIVSTFFVLLVSGRIGRNYFIDPGLFPVDAVHWLERNPQPGRMFNEFIWGGYIVWKLWPEQKDFIDSHTDMTGEATREYLAVQGLDNDWQNILIRHNIEWAIIATESPLSRALMENGWRILYEDPIAVILRRN